MTTDSHVDTGWPITTWWEGEQVCEAYLPDISLNWLLFRYTELSGRNAHLGQHLRRLMGRKEQWAHCFRTVVSHTNNIVEAAFRVLKQTVLGRTRAFNVAHLLEFVCVRMEANYMARFTMAANGTLIRQMPRAPTGIREVSPAPDKVLYWDNVKDLVRSFRAPLTDMQPFRGGNPYFSSESLY